MFWYKNDTNLAQAAKAGPFVLPAKF